MSQELNPNFGMTIGRVASQISNAQFDLDHHTYYVDRNNDSDFLNGGFKGLNWVISIHLLHLENFYEVNFMFYRGIGTRLNLKME
jgi:galactose mutarotase-like enzyme